MLIKHTCLVFLTIYVKDLNRTYQGRVIVIWSTTNTVAHIWMIWTEVESLESWGVVEVLRVWPRSSESLPTSCHELEKIQMIGTAVQWFSSNHGGRLLIYCSIGKKVRTSNSLRNSKTHATDYWTISNSLYSFQEAVHRGSVFATTSTVCAIGICSSETAWSVICEIH